MSWAELRTRTQQEVGKRWDAALFHLGVDFRSRVRLGQEKPTAAFFFSPSELPALAAQLEQRLPEQAEYILSRAERICRHHFDLLGYENLDYGPQIDWHLDAVHGKRAPRRPWYRIRYLDFEEVGDAKVIWELNRHQHLVTLARAWRLSGEERYVRELLSQWHHWQAENPYPIGINWASSLEVAMRSLSWLWVQNLLAGCAGVPGDFWPQLTRGLGVHGRYMERHLSTYHSPNTHLIGEAAGLFFLGTLCPQLVEAERWRQTGWNILLEEARRQVRADGMHFEQSTYYHVYALDFFLHARILAGKNQIAIPPAFDATLEKMLEALCLLGQAGTVPRLGDDDGGRVFDGRRNHGEHLLDPLATGAVLFEREDFKAVAGGLREETLWLLGPAGVEQFDGLASEAPAATSGALASSGLYVMASEQPVRQQLVVDAGDLGALSGGHGHADALSVHLAVEGKEYLVDSGTCAYIEGDENRDSFRVTSAHNTMQVDGRSQAQPGGKFAWKTRPSARAESWLPGKTFSLFSGSCASPDEHRAVHHRWVFHLRGHFWLIRDRVEGSGEHQLELFWHFSPLFRVEFPSGSCTVASSGDTAAVVMLSSENHGWSRELGTSWYSPAYGIRQQNCRLKFETRALLPAEFVTLLRTGPGARDAGRLEEINAGAGDSAARGYRYSAGDLTHSMFFARAGSRWQVGEWSSDSDFVYCGMTSGKEVCHLILCNGSFLEHAGKPLLVAERVVQRCEWQRFGDNAELNSSDEGVRVQVSSDEAMKIGVLDTPETLGPLRRGES
jgi:hypothetical protein